MTTFPTQKHSPVTPKKHITINEPRPIILSDTTKTRLTRALLAAIILLAAILRLRDMQNSLWYDEILTHQIASQHLSVPATSSYYPLSYILIHFALKLGDSEAILRLPSYIAGLFGIWAMYSAGAAWHSRRAGLVGALLLALSSIHIYYSQDGRFYSLMVLAATVALWMIIQALKTPHHLRYWLGLSAAIACGILTHPFFIPYATSLIAGSLLAIIFQKRNKYSRTVAAILLLGSVTLAALPAAILYIKIQQTRPPITELVSNGSEAKNKYHLTIDEYAGYLADIFYHQDPASCTLAIIVTLAGCILLIYRLRWLSAPLLAIPVLLPLPFFLISVTHFYLTRYFITQLPVILILISICLVEISNFAIPRTRRTLTPPSAESSLAQHALLFLLLASFIILYWGKNLYPDSYENWNEYAEVMRRTMTGDDIIIHFNAPKANPLHKTQDVMPPAETSLEFYLRRIICTRRDIMPWRTFITSDPNEVTRLLHQYPNRAIWLIHWKYPPIKRLAPETEKLFDTAVLGYAQILSVAAAPTTNLITHGDFETSTISNLTTTGTVSIASGNNTFQSQKSLQLNPPNTSHTTATVAQISITPISSKTTTTTLNPSQPYSLSLMLRLEKIAGDSTTTGTATIALTGIRPDGAPFRYPLADFYGTRPWHFESFLLRATDYPDAFTATSLQLQFTLTSPTGAMYVDNIQFEPREHPTPFTNGTRLPHDQALSQLTAHPGPPTL